MTPEDAALLKEFDVAVGLLEEALERRRADDLLQELSGITVTGHNIAQSLRAALAREAELRKENERRKTLNDWGYHNLIDEVNAHAVTRQRAEAAERDTLAAQGMSRADSRRAFKEAIKGETPA